MGRLILLATLAAAALASCYSSSSLDFTSENGHLYVNGERFKLKGINWFGMETTNNVFHGLWAVDYKVMLDLVQNLGFNALRVPFWLGLALNDATPNSVTTYNMNADLVNLSSLAVMDKVVSAAADRGILIMFDMHSFKQGSNLEDGYWFDSSHPESMVLQTWDALIARYKDSWNVFAFDLKNEPFSCTWNAGVDTTDWNTAIVRIGKHIFAQDGGSRFLLFGEGTGKSPSCTDACFYGEDLIGALTTPIDFGNSKYQKKFVYSPHVYGPDVATQSYWSASNYPDNMPAIWEAHWGTVASVTGNAVVVGEWGGSTGTTANGKWMTKFANYLVEKDLTDNFYWCLNPDSGDTGGVLGYDWTTVDTARLAIINIVQPSPTKITYTSSTGQVCFETANTTSDTVAVDSDTGDVTVVSSADTTPVVSSAGTTPIVVDESGSTGTDGDSTGLTGLSGFTAPAPVIVAGLAIIANLF